MHTGFLFDVVTFTVQSTSAAVVLSSGMFCFSLQVLYSLPVY